MTDQPDRPYNAIRDLVSKHGGSMIWKPMGAGGDWELFLEGRTAIVECRGRRVNELDSLYVAKEGIKHPQTWDDFERDAPLVKNALWGLVRLLSKSA